jgi:hypothetical protein
MCSGCILPNGGNPVFSSKGLFSVMSFFPVPALSCQPAVSAAKPANYQFTLYLTLYTQALSIGLHGCLHDQAAFVLSLPGQHLYIRAVTIAIITN